MQRTAPRCLASWFVLSSPPLILRVLCYRTSAQNISGIGFRSRRQKQMPLSPSDTATRCRRSRQVLQILQQVYCQTDHGDARWPLYQCGPRRSRLSPLARRHDSQQNHAMEQTARVVLRCGQSWVRRCSSSVFCDYFVRSNSPHNVSSMAAHSGFALSDPYAFIAVWMASRSAAVSVKFFREKS